MPWGQKKKEVFESLGSLAQPNAQFSNLVRFTRSGPIILNLAVRIKSLEYRYIYQISGTSPGPDENCAVYKLEEDRIVLSE